MTMAINATESNIFTNYHPTKMEKEPKKEKATITLQEWWNGEKSVTSTMARRVGWENLADWLEDKDKVCTDGQDDGKLGFKEGAKSFAKGLVGGIPKAIIQHPLITGVFIGVGAAAIGLSGGAAAPLVWGIGATLVAGSAVTQGYKAITADTDAEKKAALEGLGTTTQSAILVGTTYKPTMQAAAKAGVDTSGNIAQTMKSAAEISARNAKANYMTWKTGVVQAHSNKLQGAHEYMSKPNDVDAYRFNPNGTPEEILANNPHVEQVNGKFGVSDKWASMDLQQAMKSGMTQDEAIAALKLDPAKVANGKVYHLIDPDKNPMIMIYDEAGLDFAVCEGGVFKGSYVDQAAFHADGTLNYQDPTKLTYGQRVQVTKQAPGAFKNAPVGTKVQTVSEGIQTVQEGQVIAIDHAGNPYVTPAKNITARNFVLTQEGKAALPQYQTLWQYQDDLAYYQNQAATAKGADFNYGGKYDQAITKVHFYEDQIANVKKTYKISD